MIYFSVTFKPQSVFIHTAESHPFGIYQQPIVHVGLGTYGWPTVQAGLTADIFTPLANLYM